MALAAFAVRSGEETRQMQVVCVDDLVPADDDLRRIEALVDWGQVRRTAEPFYRPGGAGRPGLDPSVLVKLALVLAWRGMGSMRQTLRVAATDVSIRRFLGFGLTSGCRIIRRSVTRRPSASRTPRSLSSSSRKCCASAPRRDWSAGGGCWWTRRISRPTRR